jgi:hypothetical protein
MAGMYGLETLAPQSGTMVTPILLYYDSDSR